MEGGKIESQLTSILRRSIAARMLAANDLVTIVIRQ